MSYSTTFLCFLIILFVRQIHCQNQFCYDIELTSSSYLTRRCFDCSVGKGGTNCKICSVSCAPLFYKTSLGYFIRGRFCDSDSIYCFQCNKGRYGPNCNSNCYHRCDDSGCDSNSGNCFRCDSGYYGPKCYTQCPSGCDSQGCDQVTGDCVRCYVGWYGDKCMCTGYCSEDECDNIGKCNSCSDRYWGEQCTDLCPTHCSNDKCDRETRTCTDSCDKGWYSDLCDVVCSKQCVTGECRQTDGYCTYGCDAGWYGNYCTEQCTNCSGTCLQMDGSCANGCIVGQYGNHCQYPCSTNCSQACDQNSGKCDNCHDSWYGDLCDLPCNVNCKGEICDRDGACSDGCEDGWTGQMCDTPCDIDQCLQCDKGEETTVCSKCNSPYTGSDCSQQCPDSCVECSSVTVCTDCMAGRYGQICENSCVDHCILCYSDSYCQQCEEGWYRSSNGRNCIQCSSNCIKCSGATSCEKCDSGWYRDYIQYDGWYCSQCSSDCIKCSGPTRCEKCDSGWYRDSSGSQCVACPDHCTECQNVDNCTMCQNNWEGGRCQCHVNCNGGLTMCNQDTGQCTVGCTQNYYGDHCDIRCDDCQTCDQSTGVCTSCQPGYFGLQCNDTCSLRCLADGDDKVSHCNITTGHCVSGCITGYTGNTCAESLQSTDETDNAADIGIGAGVAVVLALASVIILLFLFYRRRRLTPDKTEAAALPLSEVEGNAVTSQMKMKKEEPDNATELHSLLEGGGHNIVKGKEAVVVKSFIEPAELMEEDEASVTDVDAGREYYNLPKRKPINVDKIMEYVLQMKSENNAFTKEHMDLPQGLVESYKESAKVGNRGKCRYRSIYPYDHSRVILDLEEGKMNTDFINACYIDGYDKEKAYVASQGPVDFIMADFWRMVWQLDSPIIIMLTNLSEEGKMKCCQYWPDPDMLLMFGTIHVKAIEEEEFANFVIRTFEITKKDKKPGRIIKQFHFTSWPDRGVPKTVTALIDFRNKVCSTRLSGKGPYIVHCSAGVGRTGTYIGLDTLMNQTQVEKTIDIFSCIDKMRHQRPYMVQTAEQYEFLYNSLVEALNASNCSVPTSKYSEYYTELKKTIPDTDQTGLQEQFKTIQNLTQSYSKEEYTIASKPENKGKNRYSNVLAADSYRVILSTDEKGHSNYINAVYLPGYKQRRAFILTEAPQPNTVVDFWRMVEEESCSTIVMMNNMNEKDKSVGKYLPEGGKGKIVFGPYTVEVKEKSDETNFSTTTVDISHKGVMGLKTHTVKQFEFKSWPKNFAVPESPSSMLKLMEMLLVWQRQTGNEPIIVHCLNGAERSGLLCTIFYVIDRLKVDQEIHIMEAVLIMKSIRQQIIHSQEQYAFCHETVYQFLDEFNTYSNFM